MKYHFYHQVIDTIWFKQNMSLFIFPFQKNMDKNMRNLNKTIVLSVKWTIFEIIAVDIAIF